MHQTRSFCNVTGIYSLSAYLLYSIFYKLLISLFNLFYIVCNLVMVNVWSWTSIYISSSCLQYANSWCSSPYAGRALHYCCLALEQVFLRVVMRCHHLCLAVQRSPQSRVVHKRHAVTSSAIRWSGRATWTSPTLVSWREAAETIGLSLLLSPSPGSRCVLLLSLFKTSNFLIYI